MIPLQIKSPQFEMPSDALQRGMSLHQMADLGDLRKQQIQENELKLQEQRAAAMRAQQERDDDATFHQAWKDNKGNADLAIESVKDKIDPRSFLRIQGTLNDHKKAALSVDKDTLAKTEKQNGILSDALQAVIESPKANKQAMWNTQLNRLKSLGIDVSQLGIGDTVPDDDTLAAHETALGYTDNLVKWASKRAQDALHDSQAYAKEAAAKKDTEAAAEKKLQQQREDAARSYQAVTSQAQHEQWFGSLPQEIAKDYTNLHFNPDGSTRMAIEDMTLTAKERSANRNAAAKEKTAEVRADADQKRADAALQRADANDKRIDALLKGKGVTPSQINQVKAAKDTEIANSRKTLQSELARNTATIAKLKAAHEDGKLSSEEQDTITNAARTAYENHLARVRDAQTKFEGQASTFAGDPVPHNDWADQLTVPDFDDNGRPKPTKEGAKPAKGAEKPESKEPAAAKPAQAASPTQPAATGKTVSRAKLAAAAAARGITPEAAEVALKAKGVQVVP